jgi:hypothetical protein
MNSNHVLYMKTPLRFMLAVTVCLGGATNLRAQGPFSNLDFEMADVSSPPSPFSAEFSKALPHWQGSAAGQTAAYVVYNALMLDSAQIGLWDTSVAAASGLPQPLFGMFSAYLMADAGPWASSNAELAQTGLLPADALSLRFATTPGSLLPNPDLRPEYWQLRLFVDGQELPYVPLDSQANFVLWGADVSGFADQTVEIRFLLHTAYPPGSPPPYDVGVAIGLDNILFSPVAIPEPVGTALLLVGGLLFWAFRPQIRALAGHCE